MWAFANINEPILCHFSYSCKSTDDVFSLQSHNDANLSIKVYIWALPVGINYNLNLIQVQEFKTYWTFVIYVMI